MVRGESLPPSIFTPVPFRFHSLHIGYADSRRSAATIGFDPSSTDTTCKSNSFEVVSSTGALSVTYPNSDSTTGYPNMYYDQPNNAIFLAGSADAANTAFGLSLSETQKIFLTAVSV